jgi:micrococcal nuclease
MRDGPRARVRLVSVVLSIVLVTLAGCASGDGDSRGSPPAGTPGTTTTPEPTPGPTTGPPATAVPSTGGELPPGEDSTVEKVIDGDTIVVAGGVRVRLIGVDTPETKDPRKAVQCFGVEASNHTGQLLSAGTKVRLVYDVEHKDRFGRSLAYVYRFTDGLFVNAALVRDGYAQVGTFPPNVAHTDEFVALQRQARDAGRGLWSACAQATASGSGRGAPSTTVSAPRPTAGGCHGSYKGTCIPSDVSDADCAGGSGNGPHYVDEKNFRVVGPDEYGLDADHDGVGCEER